MTASRAFAAKRQHGASLIELMVGITIGLLVVIAAIGTIVLTRTSGATVADSSLMISQGNNAMRLISWQLRPAGAIELAPLNNGVAAVEQQFMFSNQFDGVNGAGFVLQGTEGGAAADSITIAQENRGAAVTRDCLGAASPGGVNRVQAAFSVVGTNLLCAGSGNPNTPQPVAENVEDLQVFYWVQTGAGATATQQRMNAIQVGAATAWNNIVAVDVCLQLRGEQAGHAIVAGSTFVNCQGTNTVRDGRLHQVFRSTFRLRNQGQ